jgi:hypothetical protein
MTKNKLNRYVSIEFYAMSLVRVTELFEKILGYGRNGVILTLSIFTSKFSLLEAEKRLPMGFLFR